MKEELDLKQIISVLWNSKLMIITTTVISILVTFIINYFLLTPVYESKATLSVTPVVETAGSMDGKISAIMSSNNLYNIARSAGVLDKVEVALGDTGKDVIHNALDIHLNNDRTIGITASGHNSEVNEQIVELVIDESLKTLKERYITEFNITMDFYGNRMDDSLYMLEKTIDEFNEKTDNKTLSNLLLTDQHAENQSLVLSNELLEGILYEDTNAHIQVIKVKPIIKQLINDYNKNFRSYEDAMKAKEIPVIKDSITVDTSLLSRAPVEPNKKLNLLLSAVLGIMLGLFFVFLKNTLKQK